MSVATVPATVASRRVRVMGSFAHVVVVTEPSDNRAHARALAEDLADRAVRRLEGLEARWSRFRPTSELSQLNAAGGAPMLVSADTVVLIDALRAAWELTCGRFDPTVHDAVCDLGYSTSWPTLDAPLHLAPPRAAPGCGGIDLQAGRGMVRLPAGVKLDPGGLGKGLAADLVALETSAAGAAGVLVNVGGDLRVTGRPPEGDDWVVAIEDPEPGAGDLGRVVLADGGVATSTSARRRWLTADGTPVHHLVDPATGRPAERPWLQVTTVAAGAWWAEVMATVTFLAGELPDPAVSALVVDHDRSIRTLGDPRFFAPTLEQAR